MCKSHDTQAQDIKHRLETSSPEELLYWHKEIKECLLLNAGDQTALRALLVKVGRALIKASRSQAETTNELYKERLRKINSTKNSITAIKHKNAARWSEG